MEQIKEIVTLCLVRVPPGDRWRFPEGSEVFPSLTAALEEVYQQTKAVKFRLHAAEGKVWIIIEKEIEPEPPKRYSIYGDE